jgi:hypothetical protein
LKDDIRRIVNKRSERAARYSKNGINKKQPCRRFYQEVIRAIEVKGPYKLDGKTDAGWKHYSNHKFVYFNYGQALLHRVGQECRVPIPKECVHNILDWAHRSATNGHGGRDFMFNLLKSFYDTTNVERTEVIQEYLSTCPKCRHHKSPKRGSPTQPTQQAESVMEAHNTVTQGWSQAEWDQTWEVVQHNPETNNTVEENANTVSPGDDKPTMVDNIETDDSVEGYPSIDITEFETIFAELFDDDEGINDSLRGNPNTGVSAWGGMRQST